MYSISNVNIVLILASLLYVSKGQRSDLIINLIPDDEGYYWRDYEGTLPVDALPGGSKRSGKPTYIGQTTHVGEPSLEIGELRPDEGTLSYEFYGFNRAVKNIMVLCTEHPEKYTWIKTSVNEMKTASRTFWIPGGFEKNNKIYIGRVLDEGEKVVGKVNIDEVNEGYTGLWIGHNGVGIINQDAFELLVYNSNATKKSTEKKNAKIVKLSVYKFE